jgi:hypothetical protein
LWYLTTIFGFPKLFGYVVTMKLKQHRKVRHRSFLFRHTLVSLMMTTTNSVTRRTPLGTPFARNLRQERYFEMMREKRRAQAAERLERERDLTRKAIRLSTTLGHIQESPQTTFDKNDDDDDDSDHHTISSIARCREATEWVRNTLAQCRFQVKDELNECVRNHADDADCSKKLLVEKLQSIVSRHKSDLGFSAMSFVDQVLQCLDGADQPWKEVFSVQSPSEICF